MVRFVDNGASTASEDDALAPVIPLFGGGDASASDAGDSVASDPDAPSGGGRSPRASGRRGGRPSSDDSARAELTDDERATRAKDALVKRLRSRSLSVRESESFLRTHEITDTAAGDIIDDMLSYGYLNDTALAEQLVHAGADRKGQGRQAIAQTLMKRGIPREEADAVIAALPDDDAERALEFARTKARSLGRLERDVALRRLAGQLSRRGYGGSVAFDAARRALDEESTPARGVRFD